MTVALIVPAAGSGSRFGGEEPKQFATLGDRSVLAHSLGRFADVIDEAVIATNPEWIQRVTDIASEALPGCPLQVVAGGGSRQDSVHAAISVASSTHVLVHDAARPLVPRACIAACIEALSSHEAAVVAVPMAATVKDAADGHVKRTVPREGLWMAQTPQGISRDVALRAFDHCRDGGIAISDDVQACEAMGVEVAIVPGDQRNLKITVPEDLVIATALLSTGNAPD